MIDRHTFVERRRAGIGGSDIAAIIGLKKDWATPYDVWRSKVDPDLEREARIAASPMVQRGIFCEPEAIRKFSERTGLKVQRCNHMFHCSGAPVFIANLDGVIVEDGHAPVVRGELRTRSILECKTPKSYSEWGEEWTDQIPEHYKAQAQWYMGVTGAARCWFSALFADDWICRVYLLERDDDVIAYLFQEGGKFWRDYVATKTPPPPQTYEDAARRWSGTADVCTADAELSQQLDLYRAATAERKEAERREDAIKAQICGRMGDCSVLATASGRKLASWSASKDAAKVDYKSIVEELNPSPEIIEKYTFMYKTARRFTLAAK